MKEAIRNARLLHFFDRPRIIGIRLLLRQATLHVLWLMWVIMGMTRVIRLMTPPKVLQIMGHA